MQWYMSLYTHTLLKVFKGINLFWNLALAFKVSDYWFRPKIISKICQIPSQPSVKVFNFLHIRELVLFWLTKDSLFEKYIKLLPPANHKGQADPLKESDLHPCDKRGRLMKHNYQSFKISAIKVAVIFFTETSMEENHILNSKCSLTSAGSFAQRKQVVRFQRHIIFCAFFFLITE